MTDRIDGIDIIPAEEYFSENGKVEEKTAPLPPPPKFPLEALPEAMSELARDGAKAIQCPEDFLAVAVLGAAAAAIGSSRVARIKSSWLEPSVIFAGIIGPSGDGKSPAEKEATLPISEKQKDLYRSYKAELRKYEQKLREHKVEEKTAAKEGRAADPPPKKPYLQSTFVQDTTPEALVKALHNNPRGLLRIEDELGGMVAAFDQYKSGGKGRERDLWLSIWAAHEIKVDRKSDDGSLYVPMPCVSLMGNIQPKMLFRLLPYGEDHDGFAARILLSYPESKKVDWTEDEISANTRAKYKNLLTGLYELEPNVVVNDFDEEEKEYLPKEVGFSAEAKTRFSEYFNETTAETREPGFDDRLRYPWAKFRGYGARIALVLAMCRVVDGEDLPEEITFEDVENAVKVMDYFKAMARRVYASIYGQRPEDQLAANIVELLKTLPGERWRGEPEEGFNMIRETSNHAPAAASELCKKLSKITADHPTLRFDHGRESNRERTRYWHLELIDPGDPDRDPDPQPPDTKKSSSENGVRRVRGVRNGEKGSTAPEVSKNGHVGGDVIPFPAEKVKPKKDVVRKPKKEKPKKPEVTEADFLKANEELAKTYNLIWRDEDIDEVVAWLKPLTDISLDSETYGEASQKEERKKLALSFVKGKIRLIQLSDGEKTYFLDAMFLSKKTVARVLRALKGKTLYLHNAIFDVPRFKRQFGVDLLGEDIRDTLVFSRLARAGEFVDDKTRKNRMRTLEHSLANALRNEGVAEIDDETDHRWEEPLKAARLDYARDDVIYLIKLEQALTEVIEDRNLTKGLELFRSVYPAYLRMQYRGVPLKLERFEKLISKYRSKRDEALAKSEEHKPLHPDGANAEWNWGNYRKYEPEKAQKAFEAGDQKTPLCPGRNGALRALAEAGIELPSLKKHIRIEYLRDHPEGAELLEALHQYYLYSDLVSDCEGWLKYSYEDGRLYPNVNPFSQVTGRSAYSGPGLQNTPKQPDEEGELSLRDCIQAEEGQRITKADYAAQELRILAEETGDEALIKAFTEGDPHVIVAEKVAGHKLTPGTDEYKAYRKLGKRANYGFSYGAGAPRYAQSVYEDTSERISEDQAKKEQKAFRDAWQDVYKWQQEFGARDGKDEDDWYALSHLNRRRYVGQKKDKYSGEYVPNYSDRLNAPIQMKGAEMLYLALKFMLEDKAQGLFPEQEILLTTHDEIALEGPEDKEALEWLESRMLDAAALLMRPELSGEDCVEGDITPSWGGK